MFRDNCFALHDSILYNIASLLIGPANIKRNKKRDGVMNIYGKYERAAFAGGDKINPTYKDI
jgi:hypothetical protein